MFMKSLLLKLACTVFFLALFPLPGIHAGGIPVFDGANLTQNTMSAIESVAQTLQQTHEYEQQVMQYVTQLQQLEDQIKNTAAPALYLWDQVESTMKKVQDLQSKIEGLYSSMGDVDGYLSQLGTVDYWKGAAFYDLQKGHSTENLKELLNQEALVNEAQLKANEDLIKTVEEQKSALSGEASHLSSLQSAAQAAGGRMEAIQSTNQFMAQQNSLLLNMKSVMLAQSQALGQALVKQQQDDAMRQAATEAFFDVTFTEAPEPDYTFK